MARSITETLNDLNIATQEYTKELVRVVSEDNVVCKRMLGKSESVDGGDYIKVPLRYGKEQFGSMAEYDSISLQPKDILDEARYNWSHINGNVSISEETMKVKNAGRRKLLNLVKVRTMNLADTFKDGMSDMLFAEASNQASTDPDSLHDICATTNPIGGITHSATLGYTWNPTQIAPAGTPTFANLIDPTSDHYIMKILRNAVGQLTIGSDKPTLILTTQPVWDAYEQVLADLKRMGQSYSGDSGFDVLKFRHVDVVVDNHVQGGKLDANSNARSFMYVLNEDFIGFYHSAGFNFQSAPWKRAERQHVYFTELDWYGGLGVSRRDMQGSVSNLPVGY